MKKTKLMLVVIAMLIVVSVSYTHLDVYKRQTLQRGKRRPGPGRPELYEEKGKRKQRMRPCLTQFIIIKKAGVLKTPAFFISNREIKEQEVVCLTEERKRKFLQQYRLLDQDIRRKKAECDIWKDRIQYLSWTQDSGTIPVSYTHLFRLLQWNLRS